MNESKETKKHPLKAVREAVESAAHTSGNRVATVFDLDSTLFCVSPRTQAILRTLGNDKKFAREFSEAATHLRAIEVIPTDWGIRPALKRTPVKPSPELIERVREHWRKNFFSSEHLHLDLIYPAANEYVRLLERLGAEIFYLTGRHAATMREGTLRSLNAWGFPLPEESRLIMKPNDLQDDESFKVKFLKQIAKDHSKVWFFENEPLIIHDVLRQVPEIQIVFMDSVHSGKATAPSDLLTIGMSYMEGLN